MAICTGCGIDFPNFHGETCQKCLKRADANSEVERGAVEKQPQCLGCSVIYLFMKNERCGVCTQKEPDANELRTSLIDRASQHQKTASDHCLNQAARKQNPQLQQATRVKEQLAMVRKASKVDTYTTEISLWIYPKSGKAPKRAQTLPIHQTWKGSESAKDILEFAKVALKKAHDDVISAQQSNPVPLNFADVQFGLSINKTVHHFQPTENHLVGTVEAMFESLKLDSKLSANDVKEKRLPLRVYVFEVNSWSDDDEDELFTAGVTIPQSTRRSSHVSTKRKASSAGFTSTYASSFRPRKKAVASFGVVDAAPIDIPFDSYEYTRMTMTTDKEGQVQEHISLEPETIKIARDWKENIGDNSKDGYLAKGFMKFAFLGRTNSKTYAIFQCKPERVNEAQNQIDLIAELRLLALGQYFAESFTLRLAANKVEVSASIRWNFNDAFIGNVCSGMLPCPVDSEKDLRSLSFTMFLAAPLLTTTGLYTERKFSGSDQAGNNIDEVGRLVDAYAHHVLVDSQGSYLLTDLQGVVGPDKEVILFDPQAHSREIETGFWDGGCEHIKQWQKEHKCQSICRKLGLKDAVVNLDGRDLTPAPQERARPLRLGFSPVKAEKEETLD